MAQSFRLELFSRDVATDADDNRRPGPAAGMCQCGEPDAGAVGSAAARNRNSDVDGCEPVAAGAATAGGKPGAGDGGGPGRIVDHIVDFGHVYEIPADDGFPALAERPNGPDGAPGDVGNLSVHWRNLRNFARSEILERGAGGGIEGGHRK